MKKFFLTTLLLVSISAAAYFISRDNDDPVPVPASPQRAGGDAKKGYEYLVTGNYVKGGLPINLFLLGNMGQKIHIQRDGLNKNLPHAYTAVKTRNNEVLVAPNCLQCHAQVFDDQLIIGLGNSLIDFTKNERFNSENIELLEKILKANAPSQYEAAAPFINVTKTVTQHLYAETRGVNVADKLAAVLAAHRDPVTFQWKDQPFLPIPKEVIPTDTPAWWLLKKKNAMFYNGFGRGDFGRFLMASNLLTVNDTSESRTVDEQMPHVLAYLNSLEAPKYPKAVNQQLASKGRIIFDQACSGCHGTYGPGGQYPNLLIPQSVIGTDSLLHTSNYSNPQFIQWFNKSWFTTGDHPARLVPFNGYLAPPLDGVWITAPYLHNGSVPDLEGVLDSRQRPKYWSRNFDKPEYNYQNPGWKYQVESKPGGNTVYNTTLPGYGNYGHYFGDRLSSEERKAVIEYLKTL